MFRDSGVQLLEVKGPGDQLRLEQRLWLDRLIDAGLDVAQVKVTRG